MGANCNGSQPLSAACISWAFEADEPGAPCTVTPPRWQSGVDAIGLPPHSLSWGQSYRIDAAAAPSEVRDMARPLRIHVANGWYYATSRGNGGEAIYRGVEDRRQFLGLLSELPERFGTEIHAFALLDDQYHLLVRCRRADLSETLRWLQTTYSMRFNWAHQRHGHVFQGRFKSVLILDERALDEVARYVHLSPVGIIGMDGSRADRKQPRVRGVLKPSATLVARRKAKLRNYPWSSWRMYSGQEPASAWLSMERIGGKGGASGRRNRRAALLSYTEEPLRQGAPDSPWKNLVGGVVLGETAKAAKLIRKAAKDPEEGRRVAARLARQMRPEWNKIIRAAESILGRRWEEICGRHGDWARDAVVAVATRHLGWRMVDTVTELDGIKYPALAQGVGRFWRRSLKRPELMRFVQEMRARVETGYNSRIKTSV